MGEVSIKRMVFGIDPGRTGAIVSICASAPTPSDTLQIFPFSSERVSVVSAIRQCVGGSRPFASVSILLERAFVKPGSGIQQAMTYMEHYGVIIGCLLSSGIPLDSIHELTPQQWQRYVKDLAPKRAKKGERAEKAAAMSCSIEDALRIMSTERRQTIKENSRFTASRLFPKFAKSFSKAKDDGKADAALMAYVCLHVIAGTKDAPNPVLVI